jgi:DNA-3-methyladenine glycosylase I
MGGTMFQKQPWMQRAGEYPQSDHEYFNLLARAVFSAGLGPKVVESRWKDIGTAFHDFDPAKIREMDEADVGRLLSDPGVIRNRRKIEAVIKNASTFLDQTKKHKSFHAYLGKLGAASDLESAAEKLAETFTHLGRSSALLFLYSAGWRVQEGAEA